MVFEKRVTDPRTDGWTDGRTDRPGYRDARTHLKTLARFLWARWYMLTVRTKQKKIMIEEGGRGAHIHFFKGRTAAVSGPG